MGSESTLDEEKTANQKLNELALEEVNAEAMSSGSGNGSGSRK
jgi:hypothetical protein